jgi:hypothetical protein
VTTKTRRDVAPADAEDVTVKDDELHDAPEDRSVEDTNTVDGNREAELALSRSTTDVPLPDAVASAENPGTATSLPGVEPVNDDDEPKIVSYQQVTDPATGQATVVTHGPMPVKDWAAYEREHNL